jgi:hypothetical protein
MTDTNLTTLPKTRKEAIEQNVCLPDNMFIGKPCIHGHGHIRYKSDGRCAVCIKNKNKRPESRKRRDAYAEKNKDNLKKYYEEYRRKNREKINEKIREIYYRNREKINEEARKKYAENHNGIADYKAKYRKEKADEIAAYVRNWRKENPEHVREMNRDWRKNNPAKWREISRRHDKRRSERARAAEGTHTDEDVFKLLNLQKHKCANCKCCVKKSYHLDHIMPLAKGGSNWPSNLQVLCPSCNMKKSCKDPIVWAQENGRLL